MSKIQAQGRVSKSQIRNMSTYISLGHWSTTLWTTNNNTTTPTLLLDGYTTTTGTIQGIRLSPPNHLMKATYLANHWDMERMWFINEMVDTPRLVHQVEKDLGIPLTHNMTYTYVVPHIKGTMNYMGLTWKSKGFFFRFPHPPAQGILGQEVTYSIPDSDLIQHINHITDGNIRVEWFASGVRDVDGAGGFGSYNDEKRRTLTVGNIASATINFYFTQPHMIPTVNYKVSVSTPDGIVDVLAVSKETSVLKFCVDTNIQLGVSLVEPNDTNATKIHVSTPEGIKAFQSYSKYKNIEMSED